MLQENELNATTNTSDSQGPTEPWDTLFNRATNAYKKREKWMPPMSTGRVSGFGTGMKFGEYYKEEVKKRKERKTQSAAEVEQLKKRVDSFP